MPRHNVVRMAHVYNDDDSAAPTATQNKMTATRHAKNLLHRLMTAMQCGRTFDMENYVGNHELGVPLQLFKTNGDIKLPGSKAKMACHFATPVPQLPPAAVAAINEGTCAVMVDGNALLQTLGGLIQNEAPLSLPAPQLSTGQ